MKAAMERAVNDGLVAGTVAYATTATFFGVVDVMAGRPLFHTPALLGSWLFYGVRDPVQAILAPGPVLAYNGVHLVGLIAVGTIAAAAASLAERRPSAFYPVVVLALGCVIVGTAMLFAVTVPVAQAGLPWWSVGGASMTAVLAMTGYLGFVRPGLREGLRRSGDAKDALRAGEPVVDALRSSIQATIDIRLWAAARPLPRLLRRDPYRPPLLARSIHCPTLQREVRLAWTPPIERADPAPSRDLELLCLDHGDSCTTPICPLFGLPPHDLAARLERGGIRPVA